MSARGIPSGAWARTQVRSGIRFGHAGTTGLAVALCVLPGCNRPATTNSPNPSATGSSAASAPSPAARPSSRPSSQANTPAEDPLARVIPRRLVVLVALPEDRDGNGFPDQLPVILYLFGNDELPTFASGTLRATLRTADEEIIRQWAIPSDALQQGARQFPAGPGYQLGLQLEPGQDRMPRIPADLIVQFEPTAAPSQVVGGLASLHLGAGRDR